MEQARRDTIEAGGYVLIYEGAVPTAFDGNVLMVGGEKGIDSLMETAEHADAVIALGSCACDGGWMAARPNDAHAMGVQKFLSEQGISTPVVNIPCCPANPEWLVAVIVEYTLMGRLPKLNSKNQPAALFNQTVHDNRAADTLRTASLSISLAAWRRLRATACIRWVAVVRRPLPFAR